MLSKLRLLTLATLLMAGLATLAPHSASAETMSEVLLEAPEHGKLQSFSRSEYYIKAGGTPPTLDALATEPRKFFRHEMAYATFKRGIEIQLGRKLGDGALKRLLAGNKVQLVACEGSIYTTGVDRAGNVAWFTRSCARGEQLLQLRVAGAWVTVASMGCLNLVDAPIIGKLPAPVVITGEGFTPPPQTCKGKDCTPTPPPECKGAKCNPPPSCTKDCAPTKPTKTKGNNGWGNGDQSPPGKSADKNNAENNTSGKEDPSHGGNAGGNGQGNGQGGGKGNGKGKNK